MLLANCLAIVLVLAPVQVRDQTSHVQKQEFIELLKTLPLKGEFYTDDAIKKAGPYLPVLLALTEKDIEKYDIYPFLAISRGLGDQQEYRDYAVRNFAKIKHPKLKLFFGVILFDSHDASPEIHKFLRDALVSKKQAPLLLEMTGPEFESFKKRVLAQN
jgi:hypothetical protein